MDPVTPVTVNLAIDGMTCASCAGRIEKALARLPGVDATVNLATERARIRFAPGTTDIPTLMETVRKAGYGARELAATSREAEKSRHAEHYRRELRWFWLSAVLTLPLLLQMGAMFAGSHEDYLPRSWQWLLATPVQFWIGKRFHVGAWNALRGGAANMDVLIALGTSMAYLYSAIVTLFGLHHHHVYFEASAAIITLVLMETTVLKVDGMTCGGCVRSVTNVLKALPGVANAEVSLEKSEAKVTFDPARASPAALLKAIEEAGYEAH